VIGATTKPKPFPATSKRPEDTREGAMIKLVSSRSAPCTNHEVSEEIIGRAPVFREALSRLPTLARADGTVLITGETGTGKELVARAVHALSPRADAPFVAVNCGALVDTLLESELFGHERGAFTDAHTRRQGLVAQAAPGTLFLDELETLTPRAQVSLLRFLQDRSYRALGSAVEQHADVRCVAATNAQLDGLVRTGAFRADLYYRVSVFSVNLPPLRERREDIVPLAEHFVAKRATGAGPAPRLSPEAVDALLTFDWPGNVRELESAIARAMPVARGDRIEARDLGLAPEPRGPRAGGPPPRGRVVLQDPEAAGGGVLRASLSPSPHDRPSRQCEPGRAGGGQGAPGPGQAPEAPWPGPTAVRARGGISRRRGPPGVRVRSHPMRVPLATLRR